VLSVQKSGFPGVEHGQAHHWTSNRLLIMVLVCWDSFHHALITSGLWLMKCKKFGGQPSAQKSCAMLCQQAWNPLCGPSIKPKQFTTWLIVISGEPSVFWIWKILHPRSGDDKSCIISVRWSSWCPNIPASSDTSICHCHHVDDLSTGLFLSFPSSSEHPLIWEVNLFRRPLFYSNQKSK